MVLRSDRMSNGTDSCPDPGVCGGSTGAVDNVGLAFGLVIAAGLCTTLGALLPFIPAVKRSKASYLAMSLALSAGVMLYVRYGWRSF